MVVSLRHQTAQKLKINHNTPSVTFKDLTINSYNSYGNKTLPSHDDEIDIPVVAKVIGVSNTGDQSSNHPPGPQSRCSLPR